MNEDEQRGGVMENPVTLVTGASSGIGREAAILLAEAGHDVALVARGEEQLVQTARLIEERVGKANRALVLPADLGEPEAAGRVVQQAYEQWGRLDAVVYAAGDAPRLSIDQVTPEVWRRCIDVNLSAAVLLAAAAWPIFKQQRRGVLVNISSMSSIDPFEGFSIYAAAKVGVNLFTRCAAREGEPWGIRAVTIAPGSVETPMLRRNFPPEMIPPSKTLSPAAVAEVVRDCVTGQRAFEPGEVIVLPSP